MKERFAYLNDINVDINVKNKLSQLLFRTENGSKDVLLTPMAKEHSPETLLSEFNDVFDTNRSKMNDVLINLEESNRLKIGPRSIAIPWVQRSKSLRDSFEIAKRDTGNVDVKPLDVKARLRPLTTKNALALLKNSTNSGLPYYTKKGIVKERVLDKFETLLNRKDPCVLFTRTQEQEKTRNVWGFPIADTLNEMRYYSPLLLFQKELPYRSALNNPDEVSRRLTLLINLAVKTKYSILSIDFSSYDSTVNPSLQRLAFNYIKGLFQSQFHSDIDYIAERFRTIGILTPYGILKGEHGVPSGSTFTNEVDSIVQAIIAISSGLVTEDRFQVQGDDGVYLVPFDKVEELKEKFLSNGLIVNGDKSYVSSNYAIYLQNLYHFDYKDKSGVIGGIYPVYRALNRLMYQERWSTFEDYGIIGRDYYSIRSICILENCKYHPLFKELVKFILSKDKYSLVVSDKGLTKYVQMISETKGAGEILNHQYGDNVSGIKSFETFKLIKELS